MTGETNTGPLQLSLHLANFSATRCTSWNHLFEVAHEAEEVGVGRLVVSDHVVFGEQLDDYANPRLGGRIGGRQPTGPDGEWLEPLTVLAAISSRTSRVRLGTSVLQVALRRPVVLAKSLATLDVISGGRLDLGVGIGWQRAEYDAANLRFTERGRLLDDSLDLLRRLWTEQVVELPSGPIHQMPKPLQPGGVPILVSGTSTNPRAVDRLVRFGSGWIPWGADAIDPAPGIARIRSAMQAGGRENDGLWVTTSLPDDRAELARLVAAGVTDFRISTGHPSGPSLGAIVDWFHQAVSDL